MGVFSWKFSIGAAIAAAVVYLGLLCGASFDLHSFLYLYLLLPFLTILIFVVAAIPIFLKKKVHWRSILSAVVAYWAVSILLHHWCFTLRPHLRWLLFSNEFKAQVLAQGRNSSGQLRHIEWDGWGGFGADTNVYLVYDEQNTIAQVLRTRNSGRFPGIPCEAARVIQVSPKWYSVVLYTDYTWNECSS